MELSQLSARPFWEVSLLHNIGKQLLVGALRNTQQVKTALPRDLMLVSEFRKRQRHPWAQKISLILIGRAHDQPVRMLLTQLQHDVSGKRIRSVLLTPKHWRFQ